MTRATLVVFWLSAGVMHFVMPKPYERIVPPPLDKYKREIVQLSGVAELLCGLLVIPAGTRAFARWWILLTLAAVYPANIYMAIKSERFKEVPAPALWARLPLQFVFAWHAWRGTEPA